MEIGMHFTICSGNENEKKFFYKLAQKAKV
jgi:hypothetical protein